MGILSIFGSVFSFLSGVAPAISGYFQTRANVEATEFAAMTSADQAQYIAFVQAQTALNAAKVANNSHGPAALMVYLFGIPPAIHWGAVYLTATFHLGIAIDPLHGYYADAEKQIALSFFLLAPTMLVTSSLAARLRK